MENTHNTHGKLDNVDGTKMTSGKLLQHLNHDKTTLPKNSERNEAFSSVMNSASWSRCVVYLGSRVCLLFARQTRFSGVFMAAALFTAADKNHTALKTGSSAVKVLSSYTYLYSHTHIDRLSFLSVIALINPRQNHTVRIMSVGFIPAGVMGSASQTLFYGTSNAGTWGATRHASHGNGGSRFELELDRRNAARGNAGSRAPRSIDGAQVGVSSDYHKTQPASNEGSRARARCPSFTPDRGGINRSLREPAVRSVAAALTPLSDPLYLIGVSEGVIVAASRARALGIAGMLGPIENHETDFSSEHKVVKHVEKHTKNTKTHVTVLVPAADRFLRAHMLVMAIGEAIQVSIALTEMPVSSFHCSEDKLTPDKRSYSHPAVFEVFCQISEKPKRNLKMMMLMMMKFGDS
ncbi:hypothetical protein EXN66_Car014952 [Channa argus]|uniref:Uncharacterized protein n=1 Tax=Channa argus TaxID=215402 RepID=A0A6G1Q9P1_CHAAH|nr:hypothetical protein EXN66_Car014952 [Channa argus]